MELQQLRCFVTVADHGSFTRAAQVLVLSQPTLSLSVSKLEAEFGTELFQRTSRGVVLTSAGESLLGPARKVLESVDYTQAAVDAIHGLTTGTLTVICFKAFTTQAAAAMSVFAAKFPTVTLRVLAPQNDDGVFAAVSSGEAESGSPVTSNYSAKACRFIRSRSKRASHLSPRTASSARRRPRSRSTNSPR